MNKNKELNKKTNNKTQGGVMKSYVNNICKLVVVCCLFGSVFADLGSNAETAKIKSVIQVITKECRNNIDIIN